MASLYKQKIQTLKGVGEKRARLYEKLGAPTVGALLRLYPKTYEDLSHPVTVAEAPSGEPCAVRADVVQSPKETRIRGGMTLYKAEADDGEHVFTLTFFNSPYVVNLLKFGDDCIFYGRVTKNFLKYEMTAPEIYHAPNCPAILPVYRQTKGLSSRMIGNAVREALKLLPDVIRDPIPRPIQEKYSLCTLLSAMKNIHFPDTMENAQIARNRLIFEELLTLQLGLFLLKDRSRSQSRFRFEKDYSGEFLKLLPFTPTGAQKRAIQESMNDLLSGRIMNRLVHGDVGSGKTAVAAALCYCAVRNGMQAALMAPTEILAQQHYTFMSRILGPAGIHVSLLTGGMRPSERKEVLDDLALGKTGLIIGTHALFSENVQYHRLGLVVTDEQHRFGVVQRAALSAKGEHPHMLVMSATPIPRTLALMIYGDLDLSILDELPPGRHKIETYAIPSDKRPRAFDFLEKRLEEGRQCYIICPMIDEGDNDMASVNRYAQKLKSKWLSGYRVAVLHGRMKPKEKESVMKQFAQGQTDVLVSTTVVEVGVDVPNATVMMIENAERYGLSQLHQLRGRVGRGEHQSYCILISDAKNEEALARLKIMCQTGDGFKIANEDLRLRGPGDFFGSRQHGLPCLKIADMMTDMDILEKARTAAQEILETDPDLSMSEHRGLLAEVHLLYKDMTD